MNGSETRFRSRSTTSNLHQPTRNESRKKTQRMCKADQLGYLRILKNRIIFEFPREFPVSQVIYYVDGCFYYLLELLEVCRCDIIKEPFEARPRTNVSHRLLFCDAVNEITMPKISKKLLYDISREIHSITAFPSASLHSSTVLLEFFLRKWRRLLIAERWWHVWEFSTLHIKHRDRNWKLITALIAMAYGIPGGSLIIIVS